MNQCGVWGYCNLMDRRLYERLLDDALTPAKKWYRETINQAKTCFVCTFNSRNRRGVFLLFWKYFEKRGKWWHWTAEYHTIKTPSSFSLFSFVLVVRIIPQLFQGSLKWRITSFFLTKITIFQKCYCLLIVKSILSNNTGILGWQL